MILPIPEFGISASSLKNLTPAPSPSNGSISDSFIGIVGNCYFYLTPSPSPQVERGAKTTLIDP
jgi:hypothetical protein